MLQYGAIKKDIIEDKEVQKCNKLYNKIIN